MDPSVDFIDRSVIGWGNRGWLDIIDFILIVCKNGSLKTHIMYKCNLNSKQVERYIQYLLRCKLLEESKTADDSKRHLYHTTELGRKYTGRYNELAEIFIDN